MIIMTQLVPDVFQPLSLSSAVRSTIKWGQQFFCFYHFFYFWHSRSSARIINHRSNRTKKYSTFLYNNDILARSKSKVLVCWWWYDTMRCPIHGVVCSPDLHLVSFFLPFPAFTLPQNHVPYYYYFYHSLPVLVPVLLEKHKHTVVVLDSTRSRAVILREGLFICNQRTETRTLSWWAQGCWRHRRRPSKR